MLHLIMSSVLLLLFNFSVLLMAYMVRQSINTKIPEWIISISRKVALRALEKKFSLLNKNKNG